MNVDQFLSWAVGQPGRYELFRGEVYAMSPETVGHSDRKFAVCTALPRVIGERALPCFAVPDGATVRIDETTAYEPDALVYCGQRVPSSAIEIPNPVIVVEVLLLPLNSIFDHARRYFRLPSMAHDLLRADAAFDCASMPWSRRNDSDPRHHRARFRLDPPGLELAVADLYAD